jgi:hypothetical protein
MKTLIGATLVACALYQVPALADSLQPNEVRALVPGRYVVRVMNTLDLTISMQANGTVKGKANGETDTGRWSVEGSKLCITWSKWNNGRKDCSGLTRSGNIVKGRGFWFQAA